MRLKHYNVGANLNLGPHDLLIAEYLPPSSGVRTVKLIITPGGISEFADYYIPITSGTLFRHEQVDMDERLVHSLKAELQNLGAAERALHLEKFKFDFDPSDYETRHRGIAVLARETEPRITMAVAPTVP